MCVWGFVCVYPELIVSCLPCASVSYFFIFIYSLLSYICVCVCTLKCGYESVSSTMKPRLALNSWSPPASTCQGMRLYCWHNSLRFHRLREFGEKSLSLLPLFSASKPVRNLWVEDQTNSSITLIWDVPECSFSQDLTYWAQSIWYGGESETLGITVTNVIIDALDPGSFYECSVWVGRDGVHSSWWLSNCRDERRHYLHLLPSAGLLSHPPSFYSY